MEVERIKIPRRRKREDCSYIQYCSEKNVRSDRIRPILSWLTQGQRSRESEALEEVLDPKYMEKEVKVKQRKNY